jgi:protein-disulfide isomerase
MTLKNLLRIAFLLTLAALATVALRAQTASQMTILRPPAGSKVALVEFADLECPDCARAAPLLEEAHKTYHIPVVIYDFPLPQHAWAFDAAVYAHFFRSKSTPKDDLETKFRLYIYSNQSAIDQQNLRSFVDKFAQENHVVLPFIVDPQGKLAAQVRAAKNKGIAVNVQHTPTIYVVTAKARSNGTPFVEVVNRDDLFSMIDQAMDDSK